MCSILVMDEKISFASDASVVEQDDRRNSIHADDDHHEDEKTPRDGASWSVGYPVDDDGAPTTEIQSRSSPSLRKVLSPVTPTTKKHNIEVPSASATTSGTVAFDFSPRTPQVLLIESGLLFTTSSPSGPDHISAVGTPRSPQLLMESGTLLATSTDRAQHKQLEAIGTPQMILMESGLLFTARPPPPTGTSTAPQTTAATESVGTIEDCTDVIEESMVQNDRSSDISGKSLSDGILKDGANDSVGRAVGLTNCIEETVVRDDESSGDANKGLPDGIRDDGGVTVDDDDDKESLFPWSPFSDDSVGAVEACIEGIKKLLDDDDKTSDGADIGDPVGVLDGTTTRDEDDEDSPVSLHRISSSDGSVEAIKEKHEGTLDGADTNIEDDDDDDDDDDDVNDDDDDDVNDDVNDDDDDSFFSSHPVQIRNVFSNARRQSLRFQAMPWYADRVNSADSEDEAFYNR